MKHLFTAAAMLFSMTAFAQVGINNTSPKATLDITAKTTDGSKPEGLIIPQLSGSNIHTATAAGVYGSNQKGLIVYASSADTNPTGATANITSAGYYYFDGTNWQKISTGNTVSTSLASGNIYVGSASNVATAVSPTGDVTISNTGATSIGAGKVTTTHLANNAVTVAKLPAGATATTFLRGDGTWVTPTDTNTTYTAGSGLTLTGTSFSANDATTGTKGIVQLSGDLTGTAAAPTVAKIQNKAVSSTAPTNGQVLKYNTTTSAWEPAADIDTNTTYTGSASINLNGTSFERTALSGDVTASANSNTTTIAANAVTSAKIADGTVANGDLDAGVGGIYKGNGTLSGNTTVAQGGSTLAFTSTATNGFSVDGTTFSVDAANNRVGMGTSGPLAPLHISATTTGDHLRMTNSASDWALASENAGAQNGISGKSSFTIVDRANTVRRMTIGSDNSFRLGGNIAAGNAALSIDGATNNVGIGTNAPITKLDTRTNPGNASPGNGAIAIGETTQTASAAGAGAIRYNTTFKDIQYSDGASWSSLAKSDLYGGFVPVVKLVARKTTAQSIGTNSTATITFPTVVSNPDGAYNATTGIYTIPAGESGLYMVSGAFNVSPNNFSNAFDIKGVFNGVYVIMYTIKDLQNTNVDMGGSVAYYMTAGQQISIASQTCNGCSASTYTYNSGVFSITKLSAN